MSSHFKSGSETANICNQKLIQMLTVFFHTKNLYSDYPEISLISSVFSHFKQQTRLFFRRTADRALLEQQPDDATEL